MRGRKQSGNNRIDTLGAKIGGHCDLVKILFDPITGLISRSKQGEMAEWFKAHAWKVCILQKGIAGSNPALSAINLEGRKINYFYHKKKS